MSLIGEALKKARAERGQYQYAAAPPPRRGTLLPWLVAAASLSLALGLILGPVLWRQSAPASEAGSQSGPSGNAPAGELFEPIEATPATVGSAPVEPEAAPVAELPSEVVNSAPQVPAPVPPTEASPPESTAPAAPEPAVASTATPEPVDEVRPTRPAATRPAANDFAAGGSYVRRVVLPDGLELHLGGIAWSETSPAALINGEVWSAGEGEGEWRVVGVERRQVHLEWRGQEFALTVK